MAVRGCVISLTALAAACLPSATAQEPNDTVRLLLANGAMLQIPGGSVGELRFTADGRFEILEPGSTMKLDGGEYAAGGDTVCVYFDNVETCMTLPPGRQAGDRIAVKFGPPGSTVEPTYLTLK